MSLEKMGRWIVFLAFLSIAGGCHAEEKPEYTLEGLTENIYFALCGSWHVYKELKTNEQ